MSMKHARFHVRIKGMPAGMLNQNCFDSILFLERFRTLSAHAQINDQYIYFSGNQATNVYNFEENILVQYLRHSKFDVLRAFNHVQNYVALRSKHNHLFKSIPDDYFHSKNSVHFVLPLPERSPDGCTIVLTRTGKWDTGEMAYDDLVRLSMMTFCQMMRDPMTQINGFKVIHDFKDTTWSHYRYCTPRNLHFLFYATIVRSNSLPK
ncbi:hypothetical protein AVEN_212927-1 [Araneus ventricosus]|uniref:CRAL-TRIO domain-containing protein n=1 Tax=Araneus ventricosus TaxID=182803 RepID=A0A4Y2WY38_ARAVE|nr:hypothetical protein AVEN_212927-1 [Araneus ventricosus]